MKKWWIILGIACIGIILWQSISLYNKILSNRDAEQERAVQAAQNDYNLKVDQMDYYHGNQALNVLSGTSGKYGKVYVLVNNKGKTKLVKQSEGLTKQQMKKYVYKNLKPKEWVNLRLGMENNQVVWEAVYLDDNGRYTFYYGDFQTGERYKKYSIKQEI
ncbi:hypothetical protein QUF84_16050 [Fictibacillus enclensis]|uniref:hypothetical protein n=1 Tax=Fictibacillus enclensis TaxID=1017270 RepID=UPI0025A1B6C2|nr:hypothetical protein [Fictibacillus enclensis]MDM5338725.1 hypothetical protein [Fictibacillus enclensis]